VVVVPGSEYGPAKRWPAAYFAQLAAQLMQELGLNVVVLGSSKEAALGLEIEQLVQKSLSGKPHQSADQPLQPRLLSLAGKTQLSEAMQWIASARAVVCNDTGLMHVAAALNVPQVALFGSSSPVHTPPLSDVAEVLWLKQEASYQPPLDCAPCFERECPLGHMRCLNDLTVARVWAQLHALLK
jgi:heptosyltransferase-2